MVFLRHVISFFFFKLNFLLFFLIYSIIDFIWSRLVCPTPSLAGQLTAEAHVTFKGNYFQINYISLIACHIPATLEIMSPWIGTHTDRLDNKSDNTQDRNENLQNKNKNEKGQILKIKGRRRNKKKNVSSLDSTVPCYKRLHNRYVLPSCCIIIICSWRFLIKPPEAIYDAISTGFYFILHSYQLVRGGFFLFIPL